MNKEAKRILVSGKVQGVWFRASTCNKALELGISGSVQNLPEGSVLIKAEGTALQLKEFISWCHSGPVHARVDQVDTSTIPFQNFQSFEILR